MKLMHSKRGFALPTVLIASIVMLIVLLAGLTSASSSSASIRGQYYNQLAKEAADSGAIKAKICIAKDGSAQWTNASPLRPNSTCSGLATECTDVTNASCYVLAPSNTSTGNNVRTSFSVPAPVTSVDGTSRIIVSSKVQLLRSSNSAIVQTIDQSSNYRITGNSSTTWKRISTGESMACGIASDNNSYCWGNNITGRLGNNSTTSTIPTPGALYTSGALAGMTLSDISAGTTSSCGIASNNNAYCWGTNTYGEIGDSSTTIRREPVAVSTSGVLAGKTIRKISVGNSTACVIASDNNAYCWGLNDYGQLGNNSNTDSSVPVAVISNGALAGKTLKEISVNSRNACVIASDNNAYCWGYNNLGQLGNNSTTTSRVPIAVNTAGVLNGKTVKEISVGSAHACVIASDNNAYCWGSGGSGQLGNSSTANSLVPVAVNTSGVLAGKTIRRISAGLQYNCALASDNNAYCWGSNNLGQLGNNSTTNSSIPVAVNNSGALSGKTIQDISSGGYHNCALASDNNAYCWGNNYDGQLGNGATTNSSVPVAVRPAPTQPGTTLNDISAGISSTCAIASDNNAYCWGVNGSGQLGNNSTAQSNVPVAVTNTGALSGKTIRAISTKGSSTCAIASDNNAYCWGSNSDGQLGNNTTTNSSVPVAVTTSGALNGKTIRAIAVAGYSTCAIASDNNAYCWGRGSDGALGNNSTSNSSVPVAVTTSGALSGKTIRAISAGSGTICVIASDNNAYCWGYNGYGQLGNNSTTQSNVPVAVTTTGALNGKTIRAIAVGLYPTCAIASDNNAYCWGVNSEGELGNNSTTDSNVPVAVTTSGALNGKTIRAIEIGYFTPCAIASDNNAYCWGYNASGGIGNNSTTDSNVPAAVTTLGALSGKTLKTISAGNSTGCAIASDNNAYCWGNNANGQLGNNSTAQSNVPVQSATALPVQDSGLKITAY